MLYIAGFICAVILAALVLVWIAYCMFIKERHKPKFYQYNIQDIQKKHHEIILSKGKDVEQPKSDIKAGLIILPSRRKPADDYNSRPDYPESPVHKMAGGGGTDMLIEAFNENAIDVHYGDGIVEIDSNSHCHSDV
ncbi:hypothetical protein ACJJTC_003135 [Scirpophaga incertulas]